MYDLRIGPADSPEMAIECVGAVDAARQATLNTLTIDECLALQGDWWVVVSATAKTKALKQRMQRLLQHLEGRGIAKVRMDYRLKRVDPALFQELHANDVLHASCYRPEGAGKTTITPDGVSGMVDQAGAALAGWIGEFLRHPKQADVLGKLERSGASERHVFILMRFAGAPFPVFDYLMRDIEQVPMEPPDLPEPLTGVWVAVLGSQQGVRWDGSSWRLFHAHGQGSQS